jgi:hypothetical protein
LEAVVPPKPVQAVSAPPPVKPEQGERKGGAGPTPGQTAIPSDDPREAAFQALKLAVQRAYLAFQYVAKMKERKPEDLKDHEAWEWLRDKGIEEGKGDLGDLTDYKLPPSFTTFTRYCSKARNILDENKHTPRSGRKHGRSIVSGREIERQRGDDE